MANRPFKIPPDVVPLALEFSQWRNARPSPRSRLPGSLMKKAYAAAQKHTAAVVARSVGLDVRQLTSKAKYSVAVASPIAAKVTRQGVVRLAPVIGLHHASHPAVVVEVEAPNGWRLRICGGDVAASVKTFMETLR